MADPTACPPEELLAELVDGTLAELPTLLLVQPMRRCPACPMRVGQHVAVVRWIAARWGEAPSVATVAAAAAAEDARREVVGEAAGRSAADVARHVADQVARETSRRPGLRPVDSTETPAPRLAEPGRAVRGSASPRHTTAPSPAFAPLLSGGPFASFAPFAGLTPGTLWTLAWRAFARIVPGARTERRPGSEGARRWAPA